MDDRLRIVIWLLGSGAALALLGAAFGAVVGYFHWQGGGGAGTTFGLTVVRAFERAAGKDFPPVRKGVIIGAADGFLFLGVLGLLLGGIQAYRGAPAGELLGPAAAVGGLMAGAVVFGILAYSLLRAGMWAVAALCAGALLAGLSGALLAGPTGLIIGLSLGGVTGALLASWSQGYKPTFTPPRMQPPPPPAPPSSTDVTSGPSGGYSPPDDLGSHR